jgi:hypothetical protein
MSYELVFWRQVAMMPISSKEIDESLRRDEIVEGLSELPVDDILSSVKEKFPSAARGFNGSQESLVWQSPNEEDSFRLTWSIQHVRVDCRHVPLIEVNLIVDIAARFGCPLYDPQTGERFRLPNQ